MAPVSVGGILASERPQGKNQVSDKSGGIQTTENKNNTNENSMQM
jgi:hypothetical protein